MNYLFMSCFFVKIFCSVFYQLYMFYLNLYSLTCKSGGAALLYTSSKEGCNISILYKYLLHRLYDFPLRTPAQIVDKDAIFM